MIEISIGVYLVIGILLVAVWPVAENISREIDRARGTPLWSRLAMSRIIFSGAFTLGLQTNLIWAKISAAR